MGDIEFYIGENGDEKGECYCIHCHGVGGKYGCTEDIGSFEFNGSCDELCGCAEE